KFSQHAEYRRSGGQTDYQRYICKTLGLDYDEELASYTETISWGAGAVPFTLRVAGKPQKDEPMPEWTCVLVETEELPYRVSTQEFLLLRVIPVELARQFKATAASGRHIQEVPNGTAAAIREFAKTEDRSSAPTALRRLSLVRAADAAQAAEKLQAADRKPLKGDFAFLTLDDRMPGLFVAGDNAVLAPAGEAIMQPPSQLSNLFFRARFTPAAGFRATYALSAASDLTHFIGSGNDVAAIDDFPYFHNR